MSEIHDRCLNLEKRVDALIEKGGSDVPLSKLNSLLDEYYKILFSVNEISEASVRKEILNELDEYGDKILSYKRRFFSPDKKNDFSSVKEGDSTERNYSYDEDFKRNLIRLERERLDLIQSKAALLKSFLQKEVLANIICFILIILYSFYLFVSIPLGLDVPEIITNVIMFSIGYFINPHKKDS